MSDITGNATKPMFAAHRRFDRRCGESWGSYIKWSGLKHVREIVSTDTMLCPSLIDTLRDEDWNFNIHADNRCYFFHDAIYLKNRIDYDSARHNILALFVEPARFPETIDGFEFCGFDILDSYETISVLLNCGGFPEVFSVEDQNEFGLLDDLDRSTMLANIIRETYPDDPHCKDCRVWGIARLHDRGGAAVLDGSIENRRDTTSESLEKQC